VVGFMSAKGEYIPPCFSFRSISVIEEEENRSDEDSTTGPRKLWKEKIHRGIFLGSVVIFSNLMLLCAVIFGELQVRALCGIIGVNDPLCVHINLNASCSLFTLLTILLSTTND